MSSTRGATWIGTVIDYRRSKDEVGYLVQWDGVSQPDRSWYRDETLDPVASEQDTRADVVARAARAARMEDGGKDD